MRVEGTADFSGKALLLRLRVVPETAFDHERLAAIGAAGVSVAVTGAEVLMLDTLQASLAVAPCAPAEKAGKAKAKTVTGGTPVPPLAGRE